MRRERYPIAIVEKALREAQGMRAHAAKMIGCAPTTITNYINRYKSLQDLERDILEERLDFAEKQLFKNIKEGKEQSLFFFMRCKGRDRGYIERQVIENVGPDGGPLQQLVKILTPKAVKEMSDEELEQFIRGECGSVPR